MEEGLPLEVWQAILFQCDLRTSLIAARTCKSFADLLSKEHADVKPFAQELDAYLILVRTKSDLFDYRGAKRFIKRASLATWLDVIKTFSCGVASLPNESQLFCNSPSCVVNDDGSHESAPTGLLVLANDVDKVHEYADGFSSLLAASATKNYSSIREFHYCGCSLNDCRVNDLMKKTKTAPVGNKECIPLDIPVKLTSVNRAIWADFSFCSDRTSNRRGLIVSLKADLNNAHNANYNFLMTASQHQRNLDVVIGLPLGDNSTLSRYLLRWLNWLFFPPEHGLSLEQLSQIVANMGCHDPNIIQASATSVEQGLGLGIYTAGQDDFRFYFFEPKGFAKVVEEARQRQRARCGWKHRLFWDTVFRPQAAK